MDLVAFVSIMKTDFTPSHEENGCPFCRTRREERQRIAAMLRARGAETMTLAAVADLLDGGQPPPPPSREGNYTFTIKKGA